MGTELTLPGRQQKIGEHDGKPLMLITSMDPSSPEARVAVAAALTSWVSVEEAKEEPKEVIALVFWDQADEMRDGEIKIVRHTGLVCRDGIIYATTASDWPAKLKAMCMILGDPPWPGGQWFRFGAAIAKGSGNIYHYIRPVNPPVATASPKREPGQEG